MENGGGAGRAAGARAWPRLGPAGEEGKKTSRRNGATPLSYPGLRVGRLARVGKEELGLAEKEGWGSAWVGGRGPGETLAGANRDLRLMYGMWIWTAAIIAQLREERC